MGIPVSGLDQVEAWKGGAILPAGWHEVTIDEATETESKTGKPQVELSLSSNAGSIRDWLTFTPEAMGRIKQFVEAVGVSIPDGADFPTNVLPGKPVRIFVQEKPRRDDPSKTSSEVSAYEPSKSGGSNGVSGSDDDIPF